MKVNWSHLTDPYDTATEFAMRHIDIKVTIMMPSLWCFLAFLSLILWLSDSSRIFTESTCIA